MANDIQVDPEFNDITNYMTKKEGDKVMKDEIIAEYKAFFGLINYKSISPIKGLVENISNESGRVVIRGDDIPIEINSYIPGTCCLVRGSEGVDIRCYAAYIQGIFGIGEETNAKMMFIVDSADDIITEDLIDSSCKGKILVGGSLVTSQALKKAVETGVTGIIVGGIYSPDLNEFIGYDIGVAITGHEQLGITLVVTEGFGKMRMAQKTFELLRKHDGKLICINGATQIRAGVIRPEIIIPLEDVEFYTLLDEEEVGLVVGTKIRVIREPYFGTLGIVKGLPVQLAVLETESKVRVLEAELEDGRRVIVPRANVEIIKE